MILKFLTTIFLVFTTAYAQAQPVNLPDMITKVAAETSYLAFGDPDHNHLDPYKLVSRPDILAALANQNYRAIAIEAPLHVQKLIDAYHGGQISRTAFIHAADKFFDNAFVDDGLYLGLLADLIDRAKPLKITIHAVDSAPGLLSRENAAAFHDLTGKIALSWAVALTKNPKILQQSAGAQQQALAAAMATDGQAYFAMVKREQAAQQKLIARGDITLRYQHDRETAQRIKALARGNNKVALIYGNLHLERNKNDRMNGDIDHHLGEDKVTTINVYYDLEIYKSGNDGELWRRMADPKSQALFPEEAPLWEKLRSVADRPEYELDLKSGTWLDWGAKKATLVSLP